MTEFEEIYDRFQPEVYRFLLGLTCCDRSAAEELTQETFYQAFLSFGRFRGECSMRTWLFQIAKNIYAKYVRRETRQRDIAARRSDEAVPPPTAELERQEMLERLKAELERLGMKAMVVTMDSEGAVYATADGGAGHCPAQPITVVDTTGAGDAFFAGTSVGLLRRLPIADACRLGTQSAASVLSTRENVLR